MSADDALSNAITIARAREKARKKMDPQVVCLCGSTRFGDAFARANLEQTLAGRIVLSVGCVTSSDAELGLDAPVKEMLDDLHLHKIDMADCVLVLNVGGYVGESTAREVAYTLYCDKPLMWLEPVKGNEWLEEHRHRLAHMIAGFVV